MLLLFKIHLWIFTPFSVHKVSLCISLNSNYSAEWQIFFYSIGNWKAIKSVKGIFILWDHKRGREKKWLHSKLKEDQAYIYLSIYTHLFLLLFFSVTIFALFLFLSSTLFLCFVVLTGQLQLHFSPFFNSISILDLFVFNIFSPSCPAVCNIHLQLIHDHFETTVCHLTDTVSTL